MPTTILDNESYPEALQRRYAEETKAEKQAEIIRMANEACQPHQILNTDLEFLERYAALVAEPLIETNKALAKEIIELKEQAEQEPVARVIGGVFEPFNDDVLSGTWELYAAPVRTKDLTDDEIAKVLDSLPMTATHEEIIRAVIAADREKNRGTA